MTSESRRTVGKGAVDTIAAAIATGAGIAVGGPVGGVVGASSAPVLSSAAGMLIEHVRQRRLHRSGEVLRNVARMLRVDESVVVDRLISDDGILELASRVILAVQDISLEQKRVSLTRALATAIADQSPATLDVSGITAKALTELDAPHIRMMAILEGATPLPARPDDSVKYGMRLSDIIRRDPGLTEGAYAILRQLIYLGVAEDATNGMTFLESSRGYALSGLGRKVLETLQDGPMRVHEACLGTIIRTRPEQRGLVAQSFPFLLKRGECRGEGVDVAISGRSPRRRHRLDRGPTMHAVIDS